MFNIRSHAEATEPRRRGFQIVLIAGVAAIAGWWATELARLGQEGVWAGVLSSPLIAPVLAIGAAAARPTDQRLDAVRGLASVLGSLLVICGVPLLFVGAPAGALFVIGLGAILLGLSWHRSELRTALIAVYAGVVSIAPLALWGPEATVGPLALVVGGLWWACAPSQPTDPGAAIVAPADLVPRAHARFHPGGLR